MTPAKPCHSAPRAPVPPPDPGGSAPPGGLVGTAPARMRAARVWSYGRRRYSRHRRRQKLQSCPGGLFPPHSGTWRCACWRHTSSSRRSSGGRRHAPVSRSSSSSSPRRRAAAVLRASPRRRYASSKPHDPSAASVAAPDAGSGAVCRAPPWSLGGTRGAAASEVSRLADGRGGWMVGMGVGRGGRSQTVPDLASSCRSRRCPHWPPHVRAWRRRVRGTGAAPGEPRATGPHGLRPSSCRAPRCPALALLAPRMRGRRPTGGHASQAA